MPSFVGIDCGFSGAIAVIDHDEKVMALLDMPTLNTGVRTELDETQIKQLLRMHAPRHVFIEKAQVMPKQGISSSGRYMESYGFLRGLCVGLDLPHTLIPPNRWKKIMMADMPREKSSSVVRAQQLYPTLSLPRKKDHGKCDALLLAVYGLRSLQKQ